MSRETLPDGIDLAIVRATQTGLPLCPRPYHELAKRIGAEADEVMHRIRRMLESGAIRRIAAVPNHYAIGYLANGMSVWDVDDAAVDALAERVAASGLVSHCYLRRRHLPLWPYNLYAMVHGRERSETEEKLRRVADLLGPACRAHEVLYSSRILKKTGLRMA